MRFLTSRDAEIVSLKPARARDMVVPLLHIDYLPQRSDGAPFCRQPPSGHRHCASLRHQRIKAGQAYPGVFTFFLEHLDSRMLSVFQGFFHCACLVTTLRYLCATSSIRTF